MFQHFPLKCWLAAVGSALVLSAPVLADDVRGVVVRADNNRHELVVEGRGKFARGAVFRFALDKDTEILVGQNRGELADLTPGKHVRVTFENDNGRPRALSVRVPNLAALGQGILPAIGGPAAPPPAPVPALAGGPTSVAGTLRRISYTDREIVVVAAGPKGAAAMETTVQVPPSAKISRDQKPIAFDDLKEGEPAVVETQKKGNQLVARSVQAGIATAAAPAPAPPPGPERKIERVRQILKMIDAALAGLEHRQSEP
jgi:hypothetical protein